MKKLSKILAVALAVVMVVALAASCNRIETPQNSGGTSNPPASTPSGSNPSTEPGGSTEPAPTPLTHSYDNPDLAFAAGTELRMGTGYNSADTGIAFSAKIAGDGITLANGKTYSNGQLKPTWEEMQNRLGMKFVSVYQGNSASGEYKYWNERMSEVDMVSGTATLLSDNGVAGKLVNLADYLDKMPNFKAYLEANPIVYLSILGDTQGAIYFSPYFDGVSDIERMPLMRVDMIQKLLDGEGQFTASSSKNLAKAAYQPYMPTSGKVTVDVVKLDGSGVEQVTKDYDTAGNIIKTMNDALAAGDVDGVTAVNMLRDYIDKAYNGYYGTTRSNLFAGQNAAWDADELVALLRCVVANPQTLNGTDSIYGLFCREDENNQRRIDMFRFAGTLFGVRGLESRLDYLYFDKDGTLHDARQEVASYEAMDRMHDMVEEGLVSKTFEDTVAAGTEKILTGDLGFMHYDYNQTQTLFNEKVTADGPVLGEGEKYMAVMVPVARWDDGTGEKFMRFTESWRSVKTDGWGISVAGINGNQDKLNACLSLIDYAYTKDGMILLSYGPDEFIKMTEDKSDYVWFDFNGEQWPEISDATRAELWDKAGGNYTNYARQYLGSTLSFVKSQSFEYQCTADVGREGAGYISTAIALGTIKHPENAVMTDNMWYTNIPTTLPTTTTQKTEINGYTKLTTNFSQEKGENDNLFLQIMVGDYSNAKFAESGMKDAASTAAKVASDWNSKNYVDIMNRAWLLDLNFYNTLNK